MYHFNDILYIIIRTIYSAIIIEGRTLMNCLICPAFTNEYGHDHCHLLEQSFYEDKNNCNRRACSSIEKQLSKLSEKDRYANYLKAQVIRLYEKEIEISLEPIHQIENGHLEYIKHNLFESIYTFTHYIRYQGQDWQFGESAHSVEEALENGIRDGYLLLESLKHG